MASTERTRVIVELEPAVEPIQGLLQVDGSRRAFRGWLELARGVEAARARPAGGAEGAGRSSSQASGAPRAPQAARKISG
jgi:hypothetical protein